MIGIVIVLGVANILLLFFLFGRKSNQGSDFLRCFESFEKNLERTERLVREEIAKNREETTSSTQHSREELVKNLSNFNNSVLQQLSTMTQMNERKFESLRGVVEERLKVLQEDNNQKLEQMRATVDEKLHLTLEKRLGDSFKLVSERLEKVHQSLGQMQSLASGVDDLKRVLSNVKTRGVMGEVMVENLLDQIFSSSQYEKNVTTKKGSRDSVEFAIRLPTDGKGFKYLPIDSKFPNEDYQRLQIAQDAGNLSLIEEASKALENRVKLEAKRIKEKYIDPPHTVEYGILFVPTEGLYAEILRRPGLFEYVERTYKVIIAGPTTFTAILNNCLMIFQRIAIKERFNDVLNLLGVVKVEFSRFAVLLENTKKRLNQASEEIDKVASKSRTIEQKLKNVQELPALPEGTSRPDPITLIDSKEIDAVVE